MRTTEERIAQLHKRADQLRLKREKMQLTAWGSASGCLAALVIMLVVRCGNAAHSVINSQFAGSSMLSEAAGGYVLTAVLGFVAGVVIATVLRLHKDKRSEDKPNSLSP